MSENINKYYVVCVKDTDKHSELSVPRRCDICFCNVWCMPFNILKIPICLSCALKLPDVHFILNKENMDAAVEELKKRRDK